MQNDYKNILVVLMKLLYCFIPFIACSCNLVNNHKNSISNEYSILDKSFEDTLKVSSNSSNITKMELRIVGEINGKGKLSYSHVPFNRFKEIVLEGVVNQYLREDWYDERCLIKYEPIDSEVKGELIIYFIAD